MAGPPALSWRRGKTIAGFGGLFVLLTLVLALWHRSDGAAPYALPRRPAPLIPRNIWQIWFPQEGVAERYVHHPELRETAGWIGMNPDHRYRLVGRAWGDEFVRQQRRRPGWRSRFALAAAAGRGDDDDDGLVATYTALHNHGLQSDLLRYLVLGAHGGVYTDIDTVALRPVDAWVPAAHRRGARLVVGLEFDRRDGAPWAEIPHDLQFCQWTVAAAPGHPVFDAMVARALAVRHNTTLAALAPSSLETMTSTGPAAWTDVVFDHIRAARPDITDLRNLSGIREPRLYGDILVLGIDAFGMGQPHSGATNNGSIPEAALLKHLFRGSWRNS